MNASSISFAKHVGLVLLASAALLTGCGSGSGDAASPAPDSITISSLDGPSGGQVGHAVSLNVKVITTGDIGDGEITYAWEQTAGTTVASKTQGDGSHESTLNFVAGVPGDVTFKVTATARGKTASQSKTTPITP